MHTRIEAHRMTLTRWIAIACCAILMFENSLRAAEERQPALGKKVPDFKLQDFRGKEHALADYAQSKLVVLAFLGTECPLARLYGTRLAKLADEYQDRGVTFLGINANVQDSLTEIAAYARAHDIKFPLLKDVGNKLADALASERTPEIFMLDEDRVVRYRGRVDDQYGVGFIREAPQRHDLKAALDDLLAGKPVTTPATEPVGCHIGRIQTPKPGATVTYSNQIARIFQRRCVECHRSGDIAPFELTDYDEVVGWAEMIDEVVREGRMPPWHADPNHGRFVNDRSLSKAERALIHQWVADGAPQGDPQELPPPRAFVSGWQLPREPDLVLHVTEEPFKVQAEGEVKYQWFTVDPGFKEDKWLQAAEIQPGNRAVVHHVLAFTRKAGERRQFNVRDGFLAGYVPGLRPRPFPQGMAKLIPAGSQLVFQVHYTPIGSEQLDRSKIGLLFADPKEVTHQVQTTQAINLAFEIPPQADNHEVAGTSPAAPRDVLLLSLMPHMHLRGKSFTYEAIYPDGKREMLLDVPAYDFNWQTGYLLKDPKPLPAGTRIHCVAHFNNSAQNLANPDPTKTVKWGDQTWNEMMIGYLDVALPVEAVRTDPDEAARNRAAEILKRYDKNQNKQIERDEPPKQLQGVFDRLDQNKDHVLTEPELIQSLKTLPNLR